LGKASRIFSRWLGNRWPCPTLPCWQKKAKKDRPRSGIVIVERTIASPVKLSPPGERPVALHRLHLVKREGVEFSPFIRRLQSPPVRPGHAGSETLVEMSAEEFGSPANWNGSQLPDRRK
jgi:hypothetical protein